jgi:MFS family permease
MNTTTLAQPAETTPAAPVTGVLASLALCTLLPSLAISSANVALPTLATAFGASFAQTQWIVLAYLLATTTLIVGAGRLGDLMGKRRVLLAGIALFTIASALGALAPTLSLLLAARALQGVGAAAMMALTMAMVGAALPKARTGSAMGLLGTMSAVGTALGPSLGGVLIGALGWQAVFAVNLPLGLVALLMVWRRLPADQGQGAAGFDLPGTLWLALTLAAYALAMTRHLGLLAVAALGLLPFLRTEARAASPLVRLERLRDPALSAALAMNALVSAVMMATLVVGPFHLSAALGLGAAMVGALMSIGPVVSAISGVPAGRLVDRFGARRIAQFGLAAMALGCGLIALLPASLGAIAYVGPLLIVTPGYVLFQAANNTAVMADVAAAQRGVVAGLLALSRNLGLITGASAVGAVFAAGGLRVSFGLAAGLVGLAWMLAARLSNGPHAGQPSR